MAYKVYLKRKVLLYINLILGIYRLAFKLRYELRSFLSKCISMSGKKKYEYLHPSRRLNTIL